MMPPHKLSRRPRRSKSRPLLSLRLAPPLSPHQQQITTTGRLRPPPLLLPRLAVQERTACNLGRDQRNTRSQHLLLLLLQPVLPLRLPPLLPPPPLPCPMLCP